VGGEIMTIFIIVVLVNSSLGLIATVLLQSGKSAGLSGSITGAGEQFFGKSAKGKEGLFAKLGVIFAVLFLVSSLGLTIYLK
jgi:preprotein translocase subunit SecG